ncbi:hypothetical protein ACFWXK_00610 [Streptomyces sp. NPDC059070]|uniref:hypothetical protein n=1 Tax=Streptomyces sp. NPDC059070 TaxID=3346713 RepID=UPI0036D04C66
MLVRVAYVILPPSLGRHRRVLAAHAIAQNALSARPGVIQKAGSHAPSGDAAPSADSIVAAVTRAALGYERRPARWRRAVWPVLPAVWGLKLTPQIGGADELAFDQQMAGVPAAVRAAFVLRHLKGLTDSAIGEVLAAAGVEAPKAAVRGAGELGPTEDSRKAILLESGEFDPCTLQARPSDLSRRRFRRRGLVGLAVVAAVSLMLVQSGSQASSPNPAARSGTGGAPLDSASLARAVAGTWQSSSRMDFTVWPVRGNLVDDRGLLERALGAWAHSSTRVRMSAAADTPTGPAARPPQLLYAGRVDDAEVVLLHDDQRVVRYTEADGQAPELDMARSDNADVTTAAAVVLSRTARHTRFLLAPWIAESTTRDLLEPDTAAQPLHVTDDGVTDAVPRPALTGPCSNWPAMQLRSSDRIAEKHAFVLTDLGDLLPVHLTYTPAPNTGPPARQPREATSSAALVSWGHSACTLRALHGDGVRAVNNWVFSTQQLPENAGQATWLCARADTWSGPGSVAVRFQPPTTPSRDPGVLLAAVRDTSHCSRFSQHILATTRWNAPSGARYLLAAGSRAVTRIEVTGPEHAEGSGTTLAVKAPEGSGETVTARLSNGGTLAAVR